jgi:hypothetical protein
MSTVMNRTDRRAAQKHMRKESATYPAHLVEIPRSEWLSAGPSGIVKVFRSRDYLVQVFSASGGAAFRLSVNRTQLSGSGWGQDIPWVDLQRLKAEAGFGGWDAVEVYPRDTDVVNVANMRHIWIMVDPLSFAWRKI